MNIIDSEIEIKRSYLWSELLSFGEDVLISTRRKSNLTQDEVAKELNMSQSEVSRLERGLTKPQDITLLDKFCDIYGLNKTERENYRRLVFGTGKQESESLSLALSLLENQITNIALANRSGAPKYAVDQFESIREWMELQLHAFPKSQISDQYSRLLLEESAAIWDLSLPTDLLKKTERLMKEMILLNGQTKQTNVYYLINKGFHHYILSEYAQALDCFVAADNIGIDNRHWEVETLRAILISAGKAEKIRILEDYRDRINTKIFPSTTDRHTKSYLLEGLASGFTELNKAYSRLCIGKAFNLITENVDEPHLAIRYIQLVRTMLRVYTNHKQPLSKLDKQRTFQALSLSKKSGFARHEDQIMTLYEQTRK